jgi:non-ribosomal peptide synthetase component F
MDNTFPNSVAAECVSDWHRLENRSLAAVLRFDGTLQFSGACVHDVKIARFRADVLHEANEPKKVNS